MLIFEGNYGRVVKLEEGSGFSQINVVSLDPRVDFDASKSIITRVTVSQAVNLQFLHTLGSHIYVYVFGDRIGDISLSGLSFASVDCGVLGTLGAVLGLQKHGIEYLLEWYAANKASAREEPVRVTIGAMTVFEGFVVTVSSDLVDPQTNIVQWGLNLKMLPPEN